MKRRGRCTALTPALLGLVSTLLAPPITRAGEIASARVALSVRWGGAAGSEALREEFEEALAAGLATSCFTSVSIAGEPDADLVLAVILSDAIEDTRFDESIAGTLQSRLPDDELRRAAESSVAIEASLTARRTGALVYRKRFSASAIRRPESIGEDAQATARTQAIDSGVTKLERSLGCGHAKLARKIRDALAPGNETAPTSR